MTINYINEINNNYMVISDEGMTRNFAEKMLKRNKIPGALALETEDIDDSLRYKYVINAKQSMEKYFNYQSFNVESLKNFVIDLNKTMLALREYLIKEDNIYLTKETCFYNPSTKEFEFCVFPEAGRDFMADLREIFQFILSRVDHEDQESIYLAYDLQELTLRDNFCMDLLLKRIAGQATGMDNNALKETKNIEKNEYDADTDKDVFLEELDLDEELFDEIRKESAKKEAKFETGKLPNLNIFKKLSRMGNDKEIYEISKFPFIIGKNGEDVDLKLESQVISRFHAVITFDGKKYYIEDMNSKNGTFVNGKRLEPYKKVKITPNDDISFANLTYEFF